MASAPVESAYLGVDPAEFTLYARHHEMDKLISSWPDNRGPTAITDHGANPGLVSHLVKLAMVHIAEKILREKPNESTFSPSFSHDLASFIFLVDLFRP